MKYNLTNHVKHIESVHLFYFQISSSSGPDGTRPHAICLTPRFFFHKEFMDAKDKPTKQTDTIFSHMKCHSSSNEKDYIWTSASDSGVAAATAPPIINTSRQNSIGSVDATAIESRPKTPVINPLMCLLVLWHSFVFLSSKINLQLLFFEPKRTA